MYFFQMKNYFKAVKYFWDALDATLKDPIYKAKPGQNTREFMSAFVPHFIKKGKMS